MDVVLRQENSASESEHRWQDKECWRLRRQAAAAPRSGGDAGGGRGAPMLPLLPAHHAKSGYHQVLPTLTSFFATFFLLFRQSAKQNMWGARRGGQESDEREAQRQAPCTAGARRWWHRRAGCRRPGRQLGRAPPTHTSSSCASSSPSCTVGWDGEWGCSRTAVGRCKGRLAVAAGRQWREGVPKAPLPAHPSASCAASLTLRTQRCRAHGDGRRRQLSASKPAGQLCTAGHGRCAQGRRGFRRPCSARRPHSRASCGSTCGRACTVWQDEGAGRRVKRVARDRKGGAGAHGARRPALLAPSTHLLLPVMNLVTPVAQRAL